MAETRKFMMKGGGYGFPYDPGGNLSGKSCYIMGQIPCVSIYLISYFVAESVDAVLWKLTKVSDNMPKGVYDRGPGKRSRAQEAGNFPPRRYGRGNGGRSYSGSNYSGGNFSGGNYYSGRGSMRGAQNQPARQGSAPQQKRGFWQKQLIDHGYSIMGDAPNMAVQSILCLIPREIHALIIAKQNHMSPGALSPITHLGFSAWVEIFHTLDEKKMAAVVCSDIINKIFDECHEILADRTDMDDVLALEFKVGVTYLEKTHEIPDKTFEVEKEVEKTDVEGSNSQGFVGYIPKEDLDIMKKEAEAAVKPISMGDLVILTLHNCQRFPIISEMAIEWLGEEFRHGLWRSQNYSTLAPINFNAWRILGRINDDQIAEVEYSANNLIKIVDREDMPFPIGTHFFDKRCLANQGITISVRAHMAYGNVERNPAYINKVWRSFSPFFKCNCQVCADTITWFDQAIWYALNHLPEIYPKLTQAGRMGAFVGFMQQNLKKPIMAQMAYIKVREMLTKVTNKLATNPKCDLKATFGNTSLVDNCELMIKDADFLAKRFNSKKETSTSMHTNASGSGSVSFLPPRVVRVATTEQTEKSMDSVINLSDTIVSCTPGENSVNKGVKPQALQINTDGQKGKLQF